MMVMRPRLPKTGVRSGSVILDEADVPESKRYHTIGFMVMLTSVAVA
jgi:hypothetical protein